MSAPIAPDDIVQTPAEAEANSRPPLLVLEPLRAFLDAHGLGEGRIRATPIGEGHSNVTYLIERDGARSCCAARRGRRCRRARTTCCARRACCARCETRRARVPDVLAVCEDPTTIGAPFYVMERIEGEVIVSSVPAAARHARGATPDRRAADRRARRDPRASTGARPAWRASASRPATWNASCGASAACGS